MSLFTQMVFFSSRFRIKSLSRVTPAVSLFDSIPNLKSAMFLMARRDLRFSAARRFDLFSVEGIGLTGVVSSRS